MHCLIEGINILSQNFQYIVTSWKIHVITKDTRWFPQVHFTTLLLRWFQTWLTVFSAGSKTAKVRPGIKGRLARFFQRLAVGKDSARFFLYTWPMTRTIHHLTIILVQASTVDVLVLYRYFCMRIEFIEKLFVIYQQNSNYISYSIRIKMYKI